MDELGQSKMSVREAMVTLAGKLFGYGEQQRWLTRVADAANISARSARSLWRGEIHNHNHRAAVAVQRAVELKQAKQERSEAEALAALYQKIIGGMRAADPAFYSEQIIQFEQIVRKIGGLDQS